VSDLYDDERPPVEGVRILGAEEARASLGTTRSGHDTEIEAELLDDEDAPDVEAAEPMLVLDGEPQLDLRDPAPRASAAYPDDEPVVVASSRAEATWSASSGADDLPSDQDPPRPSPASPSPPNRGLIGEAPIVRPGEADEQPTGEVPPLPHWSEPATGAVPAIFADDSEPSDESDSWAAVSGSQPRFRSEGSDWSESDFADDLSGEHVSLGALSNAGPVDEEAAFARDLAAKRERGPRTATRRPPRARPAPARPDPDAGQEPAPRDLPTAIMTALAVAVVAIICFTRGEGATAVLAAIIIGVATLEFASSLHKRGLRPATIVAFVAATLMPLAARTYGSNAYPVFFAMVVIVSMLWFLLEITPGRPLPSVASTLLVFAYVGGLGGFAGLILASHDGVGIILGVALCVIAYDVLGFFVGSQFGRTPIAPQVSPNKSVEGTVAGMLASVIVGAAIVGQFSPWNWHQGLVLGILVAGGAFLGDLCESMLKRDLGLKDFGALLPGHGGVLDRFDSLLFCLPIAYYLAVYLKIW
jgi:phosphatidate cytidylyltransferase